MSFKDISTLARFGVAITNAQNAFGKQLCCEKDGILIGGCDPYPTKILKLEVGYHNLSALIGIGDKVNLPIRLREEGEGGREVCIDKRTDGRFFIVGFEVLVAHEMSEKSRLRAVMTV